LGIAQNTDLEQFFVKYTKTFLIDMHTSVTTNDKVNGCLAFGTNKTDVDSPFFEANYTMAVWKTATGKAIFGVFEYNCFGGGCFGISFRNLKFYDKNLNDITIQVCDIDAVEDLASQSTNTANGQTFRWEDFGQEMFVQIPQFGTTIKLSILAVDASVLDSNNFADFVFDKMAGRFSLQRK